MEGSTRALGPTPAAAVERPAAARPVAAMSAIEDLAVAIEGLRGRGRRALAHPRSEGVSSSRLRHLRT